MAGIHAPQYGYTWQKRFSFCAISGHELALLYCYYYYNTCGETLIQGETLNARVSCFHHAYTYKHIYGERERKQCQNSIAAHGHE